jgi:hypothetical protein
MTVQGFIFDDVVSVSRRLFNLNYQSSALVCEARLRSLYECAEAICTADAITNLKWKVWHNLGVASGFRVEEDDEKTKVQKWFLEMFERWDKIRLSGVKVEKDAEQTSTLIWALYLQLRYGLCGTIQRLSSNAEPTVKVCKKSQRRYSG